MWFQLYLQAKKIAPLEFMVYLSTKFSIFTSLHGSIYCAGRYKLVRKWCKKMHNNNNNNNESAGS